MDDNQFLHENIQKLLHHYVIFQPQSGGTCCIIIDLSDRKRYSDCGKDIYEAFRKAFEKVEICQNR